MVVPARRSRELVVREDGADANLRNRTPQNIVQAVNMAMGDNDAIAAKIMHNNNVAIIFRNNAELKITNVD
jgi:hypothetical protein